MIIKISQQNEPILGLKAVKMIDQPLFNFELSEPRLISTITFFFNFRPKKGPVATSGIGKYD